MTWFGAFGLGAVTGLGMVLFSPSLSTQPTRDCQLYKVAQKPVTSYVLKPVVQEAECKPQIVKEECKQVVETKDETEEVKPRKRKHRRWWR